MGGTTQLSPGKYSTSTTCSIKQSLSSGRAFSTCSPVLGTGVSDEFGCFQATGLSATTDAKRSSYSYAHPTSQVVLLENLGAFKGKERQKLETGANRNPETAHGQHPQHPHPGPLVVALLTAQVAEAVRRPSSPPAAPVSGPQRK